VFAGLFVAENTEIVLWLMDLGPTTLSIARYYKLLRRTYLYSILGPISGMTYRVGPRAYKGPIDPRA